MRRGGPAGGRRPDYDQPGTYTVRYTFHTAYPGCHPRGWSDPYADTSSGEVTFTVRAPADGGSRQG